MTTSNTSSSHRAFTHKKLGRKLEELEKKYDAQFKVVFDSIRALMEPLEGSPGDRIGFRKAQGKG